MSFMEHEIRLILLFLLASDPGGADTRRCSVNSDGCTCPPGTFLFDGDCHSPSNFGEECYFVHQCLRGNNTYGDPFIACLEGICLCRPGTQRREGRCKNLTSRTIMLPTSTATLFRSSVDDISVQGAGPIHVSLHVMESTTLAPSKPPGQPSNLSSLAIGSVAFILLSILMMAACFCFWSLGRFILMSLYSSPTISIPEDHSVPTHHKFYDETFDDLEIGRDNPGFLVEKSRGGRPSLGDLPDWLRVSFENDRSASVPDGDETPPREAEDLYEKAFRSNESLRYIDDTTDDAGGNPCSSSRHSRCHSSSSEGEII